MELLIAHLAYAIQRADVSESEFESHSKSKMKHFSIVLGFAGI